MTSTGPPVMPKIASFCATTLSADDRSDCASCMPCEPRAWSTYTVTPLLLVPTTVAVPLNVGHAGAAAATARGGRRGWVMPGNDIALLLLVAERFLERLLDRLLSAVDIQRPVAGARVVEHGVEHLGYVVTCDIAAERVGIDANPPGARLVGEAAGSDDRPSALARLHGGVGCRLRAEVHAENVVVVLGRRVLRPDRADDHEGRRTIGGGVEQLDRSVAIHRELALGAAARAGAGGEHHCVGALHGGGDLLDACALEIADHWLGAGRLHVGGVLRVADQADHAVAASHQPGGQPHRDLPVCSCDGHQHGNLQSEPSQQRQLAPGVLGVGGGCGTAQPLERAFEQVDARVVPAL